MAERAIHPLTSSRSLLVACLLAMIFLLPAAAHAVSSQGMIVIGKWKSMDTCAIQAQRAFPDFTPKSNAQRDAKLKDCLVRQNLPPREAAPPAR